MDDQKTITYDKLRKMAFRDSKYMPQRIVIDGVYKEWVGIGWITIDPCDDAVLVVDKENTNEC